MDAKFHPAIAAIKSGDLKELESLLKKDPTLATGRSSSSHPTLLQCLALDALDVPNKIELAKVLIDAGAEINGPLVAAASINNPEVAALLLDCGAAINGAGSWSPLEEALYWGNQETIDLLLSRGASVHNLRIAAGLGRVDLIESFFRNDGSLKAEAGKINWPFGNIADGNWPSPLKSELQAKVDGWSDDRPNIINNAFVYACMQGHIAAARLLLQKGAEIDVVAPGFDYSGTALHNAALRGNREMVEFLIERGADPNVKDTKVNSTAAGWAEYGGHPELKNYLEQVGLAALSKQHEQEPIDPRLSDHGDSADQSTIGGAMLQRLNDPGQDSELFRETLVDLDEGNFTKMAALFDTHPSLAGSQCRIVDWLEKGYFDHEPEALAEAFTCACALGQTVIADLMLKQGVDPLAGDKTWLNGFHWAANNGQTETVKLLIERKVPLEVRNKYGGTVLGQAVWGAVNEPKVGHVEIINALLEAGAEVAEADYPSGDKRIDELLRRHGAK